MLLSKAPSFLNTKLRIYSLFFASAASFATYSYADVAPTTQKLSWSSGAPSQHESTNLAIIKPDQTDSKSLFTLSNVNQLIADQDKSSQDKSSQYVTQDTNVDATGNAQAPANMSQAQAAPQQPNAAKPAAALGPVINFNNVSITEFLRFVSRLTGKNFIFDPQVLQFPVTIISESPASLEDVMAALLQNLRIHGFFLVEEGNNFIIHMTTGINGPAGLLHTDEYGNEGPELATAVFQISNVTPGRIAAIIRTMVSTDAIVETMDETMRIVVTDILANINKISDIIKKLDAPNSGLEIGQYVALNNSPAALINVAQRIVVPLAADKTLILVPYQASNSIFIVSTPYLVEKTLSVLQSLDLNQTTFGLLNIDEMKFDVNIAKKLQQERSQELVREREAPVPLTQEEIDSFTERERAAILQGKGFTPEQLSRLSPEQVVRILREKGISQAEREQILGQKKGVYESELPLGQTEATQFFIHKLQYRKADDVAKALTSIATSLSGGFGTITSQGRNAAPPSDLVVTLNSVQAIMENNSLVFTGTRATLQRAKDLINQIDVPVRQVFIEALVFDTTLGNTLAFGVEWAGKYQKKNYAYSAGLINGQGSGGSSVIATPLAALQLPNPVPLVPPDTLQALPLNEGLSATAIGRKIKHHGTAFKAFASFINFLRTDNDIDLIINPKIVTEHNVAAEIFVGQEVPIKGQSIVNSTSNNANNTVATNFETRRVGVDLKVTPLISAGDMVTLIIEQTISSASSVQIASQGNNNAPPATINETRTTTRIHMPSDYFLIMSGMLQTQINRQIDTVPLLGQLPIIGFFFNNKNINDTRRNVIMYMRPKIIDTPIDIEQVTKNEQRAWEEATDAAGGWRKGLNDLKELLNF